MTAERPWYPFYSGDYRRDTAHLTLVQHGAYTLLLNHYYDTGMALPLDHTAVARIIRASSTEEFDAMEFVLKHFFVVSRGKYHQRRADREIAKARQLTEAKRKAGSLGGVAARGKSGRKPNDKTIADELQKNAQSQSQSHTQIQKEESKKEVGAHSRAPRSKGTRWPSQAVVSEVWKQAASEKRASSSLPAIDMDLTAEQFANYWSSRADRGAMKLDWERTWMNWATTQKAQANGSRRTGSAHENFARGALAAAAEFDKSH